MAVTQAMRDDNTSLDSVVRNGVIHGVDENTFTPYMIKISRPIFRTTSVTNGEFYGKKGTLTMVEIYDGDILVGIKKFLKREDGAWLSAFSPVESAKRINYTPEKQIP